MKAVDILLIEDNPGDVRLTQEALNEGRICNTLHVASDGIEAMEFLNKIGKFKNATTPDLILLDLKQSQVPETLTGKIAENILDEAGITVNKNTVPNETRSPFVTSGIRIGTPALTTRGMKKSEMKQIAKWIALVLKNPDNTDIRHQVHQQVKDLCKNFPIYSK